MRSASSPTPPRSCEVNPSTSSMMMISLRRRFMPSPKSPRNIETDRVSDALYSVMAYPNSLANKWTVVVFPIPGGPTTKAALLSVLPSVDQVDSHWERVEMESLWPMTSFKEAGLYAVVKDVLTVFGTE